MSEDPYAKGRYSDEPRPNFTNHMDGSSFDFGRNERLREEANRHAAQSSQQNAAAFYAGQKTGALFASAVEAIRGILKAPPFHQFLILVTLQILLNGGLVGMLSYNNEGTQRLVYLTVAFLVLLFVFKRSSYKKFAYATIVLGLGVWDYQLFTGTMRKLHDRQVQEHRYDRMR